MTRSQQRRDLINRRRGLGALALALFAIGCAGPVGSRPPASDAGRTRCLSQPGRGESYDRRDDAAGLRQPFDRPLFFLFCIESP